jgi:cytochrome c biogenesis protein CcdA
MSNHGSTETAVAAARSRAWRTFVQGLAVDVGIAVLLALAPLLVGAEFAFTPEYWGALAVVAGKTAVATAVSYLVRRFGQAPDAPA